MMATLLVLFAVYVWGLHGTEASLFSIIEGADDFADFLSRLFPPAYEFQTTEFLVFEFAMPTVVLKIIETLQMAIIGTTIAILFSIGFGLLAARNFAPNSYVYTGTRLLLNANRAIPEIIFGIIFVSLVGIGPFSGVLALAIGSIGSLGKIYAECIEAIDPEPVQAVRATGAGPLLAFRYGVLPQVLPVAASYSLLLFESNVRTATILGLVGAGGIGFLLDKYLRLFQYQELCGCIIVIFVVVTVMDRITDRIRKRLI